MEPKARDEEFKSHGESTGPMKRPEEGSEPAEQVGPFGQVPFLPWQRPSAGNSGGG